MLLLLRRLLLSSALWHARIWSSDTLLLLAYILLRLCLRHLLLIHRWSLLILLLLWQHTALLLVVRRELLLSRGLRCLLRMRGLRLLWHILLCGSCVLSLLLSLLLESTLRLCWRV